MADSIMYCSLFELTDKRRAYYHKGGFQMVDKKGWEPETYVTRIIQMNGGALRKLNRALSECIQMP